MAKSDFEALWAGGWRGTRTAKSDFEALWAGGWRGTRTAKLAFEALGRKGTRTAKSALEALGRKGTRTAKSAFKALGRKGTSRAKSASEAFALAGSKVLTSFGTDSSFPINLPVSRPRSGIALADASDSALANMTAVKWNILIKPANTVFSCQPHGKRMSVWPFFVASLELFPKHWNSKSL
jgi:hypothetical protein